ncbi:MAG: SHOCT domain-containing protein [Allorhizobium sp.]
MRRVVLGAALSAIVFTSGCLTIDPTTLPKAPKSVVVPADEAMADVPPVDSTVTVKKKFPGFDKPLKAANVQMTDIDALQVESELSALGVARESGAITDAEYQKRLAELRKLAAEHGPETQAQITK